MSGPVKREALGDDGEEPGERAPPSSAYSLSVGDLRHLLPVGGSVCHRSPRWPRVFDIYIQRQVPHYREALRVRRDRHGNRLSRNREPVLADWRNCLGETWIRNRL